MVSTHLKANKAVYISTGLTISALAGFFLTAGGYKQTVDDISGAGLIPRVATLEMQATDQLKHLERIENKMDNLNEQITILVGRLTP